MASTNKTTHYNLSQYIGSDKPTYLVDYNTDMSNIDTGIYSAKSESEVNTSAIGTLASLDTTAKTDLVSAVNEVNTKANDIGNLSNLTTEANTNLVSAINEVDAHTDSNNQNIGTMVNLETTVKTSLVGAINEVNTKATNNATNISTLDTQFIGFENKFNLTTGKQYTTDGSDITKTGTVTKVILNLQRNSDGTIFKLYGVVDMTGPSTITLTNTGLKAPSQDINIDTGVCMANANIGYVGSIAPNTSGFTIKAGTGNIEISLGSAWGSNTIMSFPSALYFNDNFGDTPID